MDKVEKYSTEPVKLNTEKIMNNANDVELYFYEFIIEHSSILGWMLTLSPDEIKTLQGRIDRRESVAPLILLTIANMKELGEEEIPKKVTTNENEIKRVYTIFEDDLLIVSYIKKGFISYKPKEDDSNWEFNLTEKGKESKDATLHNVTRLLKLEK